MNAFKYFLLTACLAIAPSAWSATYYVSNSGNDNSLGTSSSAPFQTLAKINTLTLAPGDQVLLQGGQTFNGPLQIFAGDGGSATNPVLISSYGAGRGTIFAGTGPGLDIYNTAGVDVTNVNFTGTLATNNRACISLYTDLSGNVKLDHVSITDVDVSGCEYGIYTQAYTGNSGFKNVRVLRAEVHGNRMGGITSMSNWTTPNTGFSFEDFYIGYSKIYNNLGDPNYTSNHSGNGIVMSSVDRITIERNIAYGNGSQNAFSGAGPGAIWVWNTNAAVIQFNAAFQNKTGPNSASDGGAFDLDGGVTNSVMQYNYSYGNDGAGYLLAHFGYNSSGLRWNSNNVVRYNISEDDGRRNNYGGIQFWSADYDAHRGTQVYNNTIIMRAPTSGTASAIKFDSQTKDTRIFNNIFVLGAGVLAINELAAQNNLTLQKNDYWNGTTGSAPIQWGSSYYTTVSGFSAGTGHETAQLSVNPQLVNAGQGVTISDITQMLTQLAGYKLGSGSALINAGFDPFAVYGVNAGTRDFFGTSIPQSSGFDIGAAEYVATNTWTFCASEGQTCTLAAPATVRYGANNTYYTATMSGSFLCGNSTFGDPIYGVAKTCEYQSGSSGTPTNLLNNSGFESNWTNWSPYGYTSIGTSGSYAGSQHAVIGANGGGFEQTVSMTVGQAYTFKGQAKVVVGDTAYMGFKFLDASNNIISQSSTAITSTAWSQFSVVATIPTGTVTAIVWGYRPGGGSGNFQIDAVSLTNP